MARSRKLLLHASAAAAVLALAACSEQPLPEEAGYGPNPTLPEPKSSWLPTIKVAKAIGWKGDEKPTPLAGGQVTAFATGLQHPRWLYALPNGDILVAESDAPPKPDDKRGGLRAWVQGLFMERAGSRTPSANRISLLRDADGDGVAETKSIYLDNLNSPFGMALIKDQLYVANADSVVRVPYVAGETKNAEKPVKVADLPAGRNHHWTKSLVASADGSRLYVGVGSNSNVAENGMAEEENRAAVLEIEPQNGTTRVFASGLRNPVGIDWNPTTGELWVAVNERDEIGDDLVPDYMTSVKRDGFYGWPYSYYGQIVDERVEPQRPDLVAKAIKPDYALGSHTASLGLTFVKEGQISPSYAGGAFIGQHGSWNRASPVGYRVIFVPFVEGKPSGPPRPVLTGFLNNDGEARGRPVGVLVDGRNGLLVADDVGNAVWRVVLPPS
ncbi:MULTISPECIES: sorbosone dehydrogenase family protein [unclassified Chelatococcus]|uniref:PQQ-dependent sugar dehydrogenase n=1 Tax=unclassified Chelatococcus TaxID=2638111 RepID=UPI001BCEDCBA|nr:MULTISPECIES: sorbosone dehydrogenase family protein [unclassified Chelatococcus]MBS7699939.1 sorbosone dehydrogenase family protein [Chelatococcus sp. YT9]MBX3558636.1 sorbosone dehydrogenase family protein [Chelatococcus sp.]